MAGRLKGRRAGAALAALTLLVLAGHLWLMLGARAQHERWMPSTPEPERLKAAFVRELAQAAPPTPSPARPDPKTPGVPEAPKVNPRLPASVEGVAPMPPDATASDPPPVEAIASLPALSMPQAVGDWQPGLEWPLSTELHYKLTGDYRGPVYGEATVQWLREGAHYQVHLEAKVGPSFAPLMTRRLSSDGQITAGGLAPKRFDEVTGGLAGGHRSKTLLFDVGGVRLANGEREPVADGVQDGASQFVQITWMLLTGRHTAQPGWQIPTPLALPRNVHLWQYVIKDLQDVVTPMGTLPAWHVDSEMTDTRGDMQTEMWLAPSLQYLPVRIRIWQNRQADPRTHIDLVLSRPPLQAMPGASASAPASAASSPL